MHNRVLPCLKQANHRGKVVVSKGDGRYRRTVVEGNLDYPTAIAVDPELGVMYFADAGSYPKGHLTYDVRKTFPNFICIVHICLLYPDLFECKIWSTHPLQEVHIIKVQMRWEGNLFLAPAVSRNL